MIRNTAGRLRLLVRLWLPLGAMVACACSSSSDTTSTADASAGAGGSTPMQSSGGALGKGGSPASSASGGARPSDADASPDERDAATPGADAAAPLGCSSSSTLPANAPVLEENVWKDITPPGIPKGDPKNLIAQGIALDPCHPGTIYWGNTPFDAPFGGLYKSVDGGSTWRKIGTLDEPLHIRVDPRDPQHLYAGDGVRGGTLGFWVSHDGGETWAKPAAWTDLAQRESVFIDDVYDVAVDPADFDHVLVSAHSPWAWDSVEYARSSGVVESKDGGQSWTLHRPELSWGSGHSIDFLHEPSQGIGDANTWLLGTQSDGIWRTTNGGASWAQVVPTSIFHGGNHIYYSKTGVLYAGSGGPLLRSSDNGAHWTELSPNLGYTAVFGDGNLLFTAPAYGRNAQPFLSSPEEDGVTWTPFAAGAQTFTDGGPFEMAFEPNASILYSSNWFQGLWALARPKK